MPGTVLRTDAVWTWFGDPFAVRSGEYVYIGCCSNVGIHVAQYRPSTGAWQEFLLKTHATVDDHNVAGVGVRPDGRILVAYSEHNDTIMRVRISTNAHDVTTWGTEITAATGSITYPNLVYLAGEAKWYLFFRDGVDPKFCTSTDNGATWSAKTALAQAGSERPYLHVVSDGVSRIHVLCTDKHPQNGQASVYHVWYDATTATWKNSTGANAGALPLAFSAMTNIHDGATVNSWVWDIALDNGDPVALFTTFPSDADHRYQYAALVDGAWTVREITAGGGSIHTAGTEPLYSAGMALNHSDPSIVYLCKPAGPQLWDVQQWSTSDSGVTWTSSPVHTGGKNLRPVHIRGSSPAAILWINGSYTSYFTFATDLYYAVPGPVFTPPPAAPTPVAVASTRTSVTWLACDLVTGRIIAELPEVTGTFSRILGAYTSSSLTVPIPTSGPAALGDVVYGATQPGRSLIVAVVNDVPTWGGVVLTRAGGTDAQLSLACVTLEGYLEHRYVADHAWTQQDQASVIAAGLLVDANTQGVGLVLDAPASGVLRDRAYTARDNTTVYQRLRELSAVDGGPEWTIDLDWTSSAQTAVTKLARVRNRIGVPSPAPSAIFESTADAAVRYTFVEDYTSGKGANHVVAYSSGEGEDQPESAPASDVRTGWPRWELRYSPSTSITDPAVLNAHAKAELARRLHGARTWQLEARWNASPRLNVDWALGDDVAWLLTGHRHPAGVSGQGRVVGWELDPVAGVVGPILWEPDEEAA